MRQDPQEIAILAAAVARAYRQEGLETKYRLCARKLDCDQGTVEAILSMIDDEQPSKVDKALRYLLTHPNAAPEWPIEAVRLSFPGTEAEHVLSLSEPLADPDVPGRYYFLSGEGEVYYNPLGVLTVDTAPGGGPPKLSYEHVTNVHAPMRSRGEKP